jgi:hypothetical protein
MCKQKEVDANRRERYPSELTPNGRYHSKRNDDAGVNGKCDTAKRILPNLLERVLPQPVRRRPRPSVAESLSSSLSLATNKSIVKSGSKMLVLQTLSFLTILLGPSASLSESDSHFLEVALPLDLSRLPIISLASFFWVARPPRSDFAFLKGVEGMS